MKNTFILIAINFAILCTLIVSTEICSQLVYKAITGELFFGRNIKSKIFEIHPFLAGRPRSNIAIRQGNKSIRTTDLHTRWTGASQDDDKLIKIAILGGSTAFGTRVSDEESWPALLQEKLGKRFAVINYGVPGYSTAEAIIQMALVVPDKQPQIVIFYEGWNDIRNYHEKELGADYYAHGMGLYGNLSIPMLKNNYSNSFATIWLIDWIINAVKNPSESKDDIFSDPDPFVDKIYLRNLKTLRLLTDEINAFGIFIPQVLNYSRFQSKEGADGWSKHILNKSMPFLMERFNSHMEGLCAQKNSNCVVLSEITKQEWLPEDFEDEGHLSKQGGLKFSEVVLNLIRSKYGVSMADTSTNKQPLNVK